MGQDHALERVVQCKFNCSASTDFSENSRRLWLSEIPCRKAFPANVDPSGKFLPNIRHEMLSLPRFGHFPARTMAAGESAAPSGALLDFLL